MFNDSNGFTFNCSFEWDFLSYPASLNKIQKSIFVRDWENLSLGNSVCIKQTKRAERMKKSTSSVRKKKIDSQVKWHFNVQEKKVAIFFKVSIYFWKYSIQVIYNIFKLTNTIPSHRVFRLGCGWVVHDKKELDRKIERKKTKNQEKWTVK